MSPHKLRFFRFSSCLGCCLAIGIISFASGQGPGQVKPVVGLSEHKSGPIVLKDAKVVVSPGRVLEKASILIDGASIVDVGDHVASPPGAKVIDCSGKTIYAGLIDAYSEIDVNDPPNTGSSHWNGNIQSRRQASGAIRSVSSLGTLRAQGITVRLVAPKGAIVKGRSCLVMLDKPSAVSLLKETVAQHVQLTVPRDRRRNDYPNSPMGATALLRQTLADANWYDRAWQAYEADSTLQRPDRNDDLAALAHDVAQLPMVADAQNERMMLRAEQIAREFSLNLSIRGSGREYRDLHRIARCGRTILVPVDFPDAPDVSSESQAANVSLRDLMHWHLAPENPKHLAESGVEFCLTTDGLDDLKDFLKNVRRAVKRGLSSDEALASLTTTPASWLGMTDHLGSVRSGALANLLITDGDLFVEETAVLETWVAGNRYQHDPKTHATDDPIAGSWISRVRSSQSNTEIKLQLSLDDDRWEGNVFASASGKDATAKPKNKKQDDEAEDSDEKPAKANLNKIARSVDRLTAWTDLSKASPELPDGPSRLTIVTVGDKHPVELFSTLTFADGKTQELKWTRAEPEQSETSANESEESESEIDDPKAGSKEAVALDIPINYPLGASGVTEPIAQKKAVLFRGATVWTCSADGILAKTDVLVVDGRIAAVGASLKPPKDCVVVNASGKHISPGLIDCHSHMGTDGGVNESGQAVTAEVRIGDFIDNSDINIYRQLAGGLTTSNILHGSANPIGGQNQVIKLRWGDGMDELKMATAPAGIKFALGENVKRSNSTSPQTRYPASRLGVEQIFRDRFHAAESYDQRHRLWRAGNWKGLPPRRDLELETLAQILSGDRWIHCHSYRQDEIVALLDLLDSFEITIGTLQHILEGYKVADRMKAHGAMASAFSDWWAYKFEVYDAIPDNGAIMHEAGIVVSFNSDDRELARHLNTEAAKAVKYGGVPAEEALKFVTLNPAKQLRIDDRVGSIEVGKDADLVVWSGPPLSTLSRCEQTWVDGRPMFSLQADQALRERDQRWRAQLIARILDEDWSPASPNDETVDEEDRWLRYDVFCHGHDHEDELRLHRGHFHLEVQR